jgi:hypothetical protein
MKITNRPTLVGALVGALALGASIDVATAQYTQDSSRVSQPGQGGVTDTANPSSRNYPSPSQDTSMTGRMNPAGQDTSSMGRSRAGDTTSMPGAAGQAGTQDTSMQRQQTGATSDTGMKKSKKHKKTAATDTGAVGQQQHKGGMTHDSTRATPDTSH